MGKHPEKILVIPREKLEAAGPLWQGFRANRFLPLADILFHGELRVRDEVEEDPSFKQVITYTVFVWGPPSGAEDLAFSYLRGGGGGEARLHALRSLGVGGHVEEADLGDWRGGDLKASPLAGYHEAWKRELDEEVKFERFPVPPGTYGPLNSLNGIVGLINDDSNPVGSVHLGVVHKIRLLDPVVTSNEGHCLVETGFASPAILRAAKPLFESWSRILIDAFWPSN